MRERLEKSVVAAIVTLFVIVANGNAQHLISSKAGFINRSDGKVYIHRLGNEDDDRGRASLGTQMRNGDTLSTDAASFAEILLNPGSYLRLSEKSEVRAVNTSLLRVEFELVKGSVILEVGEIDKMSPLQINTPGGQFFARKEGLHRFDLVGITTRIAARQGDLWIGTREQVIGGKGTKIARGRQAVIDQDSLKRVASASSSASPSKMDFPKIDKDEIDDFDVWSFNRAQTLVAANNMALRQSRTTGSLASGWIFDPFSGTYTFIPRNGLFWSPYGFGYFNALGSCFTCYGNPYGLYGLGIYGGRGYTGGGGVNGGGGGGTTPSPARVISGLDRTPVQREIEGRRIEYNPNIFDAGAALGRGIDTANRAASISVTPSSSPAVTVAPAPARGGGEASAGGGGGTGGGRPAGPSRP